ncbi:hypothetical protein ES708_34985 [subsurface metagenome]
MNKIKHYVFQLPSFHLTVDHRGFYFRTNTVDHSFDLSDIFYTIMDEKHLSVPAYFIINSLFNYLFIKTMQFGDNGMPVWWWCVDNGEVTCSH